MFNFSGSEIIFLLLLALIILGPEKLPEAIRKFGSTYAEFKKVTTGFQTELKQALDEPVREMRETAEMLKQAATFDVVNPVTEIQAEVKKAAIGPFPAAAPAASAASATAPATGDSADQAGDAEAPSAAARDAMSTSPDSPTWPTSAISADSSAGDDTLPPTDPAHAAPPRVSQIAQANASANQPFARAAAEADAAAAATGEPTEPSEPAPPTTVRTEFVQRMRTLDEVFGSSGSTTGGGGPARAADTGTASTSGEGTPPA